MKTITLTIAYPFSISARDTEGQWMHIIRKLPPEHEPSDSDQCVVISGRNNPNDPHDVQMGQCQWGKAFVAIADFMNCTALDL